MKFTSEVPTNVGTHTLLADYLANRFTYFKREMWVDKICSGALMVNGAAATVALIVTGGDTVIYDAGEFEEPAADCNYSILYEDAWLLAVNKPGNLLMHRAGRSFRNNLMHQLRVVHDPPYPTSHSIHRLDRDTSGVVLIAKTTEALAAFSKLFASREIEKSYTAIVHGIPQSVPCVIELPIGKDETSLISYKYCVTQKGKDAITCIESAEPTGANYSLLTIKILTGRTHQIRVHCCSIGHPVVGDKLYGLSEDAYIAWREDPGTLTRDLLLPRHALHCRKLQFVHPFLQETFSVEAPLPNDMLVVKQKCSTM